MQHLEEGTIHAWLDGALPPDEGRAIEEHAAGCAACAAAIAEARGLIAGSSRILAALDAVPGGVLPSADAFAALGTGGRRPATPAGRQWWRSVPLRAAAAIVLVGSVSWLATRSAVQREPASAAKVVMAPAEDRAAVADADTTSAAKPPVVEPQTKAAPSPGRTRRAATPTPRGFEVPRPAPAAPAVPQQQEAANVAAQPAPAMVGSAAAGAVTGGAGAGVVASRREFAAAKSAMLDRDSVIMQRSSDEQRLLAQPLANARAPMAAMSAPMAAPLMPGSAGVRMLTGCYVLQTAASPAEMPLLPARIELLADRADSSDPAVMVARPAGGESTLSAASRASWKTVGEHALALDITDGARSLTATLTVAGDSVSGWARTSTGGSAGPVAMVRGRRSGCTAPAEKR